MKAFYAGSFDPFTIGHYEIARQALRLFGGLVVGVGYNEKKRGESTIDERVDAIRRLFKGEENVEVISYDGLTAEAAKAAGAGVLVRGVRTAFDFEKEKELSDINLKVFGIATVMIPAAPELTYISSSMVREIKHFGGDVSPFLPQGDADEKNKKENR